MLPALIQLRDRGSVSLNRREETLFPPLPAMAGGTHSLPLLQQGSLQKTLVSQVIARRGNAPLCSG